MHANLPTLPTPAAWLGAASHKIVAVGAFETPTRQRRRQLAVAHQQLRQPQACRQVHIRREREQEAAKQPPARFFYDGHIHTVLPGAMHLQRGV
jgi:hypothetical protein